MGKTTPMSVAMRWIVEGSDHGISLGPNHPRNGRAAVAARSEWRQADSHSTMTRPISGTRENPHYRQKEY